LITKVGLSESDGKAVQVFTPAVTELDRIVESLPSEEKRLFHRLFHFNTATGYLRPPDAMRGWIEERFGSVEAVTSQKIVKITNLVTLEGALFNGLRACRPIEFKERLVVEDSIIDASDNHDPLCHPERNTPEDTFGRVEGEHCVTASNVAKYDGMHGLVIFHDYDPVSFSKEKIIDYIDTGWRWAEKAQVIDPTAKYYLFMWNCLQRGGASLLHGHAQVTLSSNMHYAKIEALRRAALNYNSQYHTNYFEDLYRVHHSLGCAFEKEGIRIISSLTPVKEKEVLLIAKECNLPLKERIYEALACFRDIMHVTAFNLVLIPPPLAETEENWEGFPVLVRLVDRGDPGVTTCDMGSMELYASSVISSDPWEVAWLLRESLQVQ
jgi:hypothetical protein